MRYLIQASHVQVRINGKKLLQDITFSVEPRQLVGLIGPNGSGKTTLLRTLSGNLPYQGRLLLKDTPITSYSPQRLARLLAFVQQQHVIPFAFTVEELVLLGRTPHKKLLEPYTSQDRKRVQKALKQVELAEFRHRTIHSLSGGELQRAFLAQALVQETPLLLLDEPTTHLDVHHQFTFMQTTRTLVTRGKTVLCVFHDLNLAARFADHLLVLHQGRLVAQGPPETVLTSHLLENVFRMHAKIQHLDKGLINILYLSPVQSSQQASITDE